MRSPVSRKRLAAAGLPDLRGRAAVRELEGQIWLTREQLTERHKLVWRDDLGIPGIAVEPGFAIGQRALLVPEADGCVMWDCVPLATREAVDHVRSLGGLKAIAVSHPHFYGAVADWSEAFGAVPVYLHGDDRAFVTRPHPAIVPWSGDSHRISDDILLVRTGGHFAGATVMHWRAGAEGRGALLTGDVAMVAMDRRSVSFMYSFPNYIPLNAGAVRGIALRSIRWRSTASMAHGGAATSPTMPRRRLTCPSGVISRRSPAEKPR